ncbi:hypothetical protein VTO42DRAFT_5022 [Malbranchea cinnamomea]
MLLSREDQYVSTLVNIDLPPAVLDIINLAGLCFVDSQLVADTLIVARNWHYEAMQWEKGERKIEEQNNSSLHLGIYFQCFRRLKANVKSLTDNRTCL